MASFLSCWVFLTCPACQGPRAASNVCMADDSSGPTGMLGGSGSVQGCAILLKSPDTSLQEFRPRTTHEEIKSRVEFVSADQTPFAFLWSYIRDTRGETTSSFSLDEEDHHDFCHPHSRSRRASWHVRVVLAQMKGHYSSPPPPRSKITRTLASSIEPIESTIRDHNDNCGSTRAHCRRLCERLVLILDPDGPGFDASPNRRPRSP